MIEISTIDVSGPVSRATAIEILAALLDGADEACALTGASLNDPYVHARALADWGVPDQVEPEYLELLFQLYLANRFRHWSCGNCHRTVYALVLDDAYDQRFHRRVSAYCYSRFDHSQSYFNDRLYCLSCLHMSTTSRTTGAGDTSRTDACAPALPVDGCDVC